MSETKTAGSSQNVIAVLPNSLPDNQRYVMWTDNDNGTCMVSICALEHVDGENHVRPLQGVEPVAGVQLTPVDGVLVKPLREFVHKHGITCPESIYQNDAVVIDALELIEKLITAGDLYEHLDDED